MINNPILRRERIFQLLMFSVLTIVSVFLFGLAQNIVVAILVLWPLLGCGGWALWMLYIIWRGSKRALVYIPEECVFGACIMELPALPGKEQMFEFDPDCNWIVTDFSERARGYASRTFRFYSVGRNQTTKFGELPMVYVYAVDED